MNYPKAEMKLTSSVSEQNVFLTYVCTINDPSPRKDKLCTDSETNYNLFEDPAAQDVNEDDHIKVERSKALHELVEAHATEHVIQKLTTNPDPVETVSLPSPSDTDVSDSEAKKILNDNPNILKLTKMKWLTEDREGSPDSRSPSLSLSPASSNTSSQCSRESETNLKQRMSFGDKYLSTILRLDKEHNLFGLSNIAIVGSRTSKKVCKKDEKPVFHQTAIVQVCCGKRRCKYKSNTDLPSTLKCSGPCQSCCYNPECALCATCESSCLIPKCASKCLTCRRSCCICKLTCRPSRCRIDCSNCYGLTLTLKRKPKYEETFVELTPRSSCVQAKPISAVECHHLPHCLPPSSCFPYLMPCYWPARADAPCTAPTRCFHNPPCPPARKPRSRPMEACPPKCDVNKAKCTEPTCPGVPPVKKPNKEKSTKTEPIYSVTECNKSFCKKKKACDQCECCIPQCASCFVMKPNPYINKVTKAVNTGEEPVIVARSYSDQYLHSYLQGVNTCGTGNSYSYLDFYSSYR